MPRKLVLICSTAFLCLAAGHAGAQGASAEIGANREVYERAYFDRFNPQTARDMIERLPGFTLDTGESLRGFGGTAGNVLVNGERPSSKVGMLDALGRIPANSVVRIELIRGTAGSSEAAGQTVVANVVRTAQSGAGSWEVEFERAPDGRLYPSADMTLQSAALGWEVSTNLKAFWERFPLDGVRTTRDAGGQLIRSETEHRPSVFSEVFLSSEASRPFLDGELTLTGRYGYSGFLPDTDRLGYQGRLPGRQPDRQPDDRVVIDYDSEYYEGEFGADWTRPLPGQWSAKLLSLTYFQDLDQLQTVDGESPLFVASSRSEFVRERDTFETVLRGTLSKTGEADFRPEFGAEIAFNRMDNLLSLLVGPPDNLSPVDLPAADVTVEEIRGEAFANLIWQVAPRWSAEAGLAAEYSDISVSGDATSSQDFFFVKPSAALIFTPRDGLQLRVGAAHTVGQLDFNNFAASASASDDRLLAGNPTIGPAQTTRLSAAMDWRSDDRGALNLEIYQEWRDDIIEQIILPSGVAGAANAGDAWLRGVTVNGSLPLGDLLDGALLEVEAEMRESRFRDPVTGLERDISNISPHRFSVEFRQDITAQQLAWGVSYASATESTFFYADEERFSRNGAVVSAFVETTRFWGVRSNLSLRNLGDRDFYRERRLFADDRSRPSDRLEITRQNRGVFVSLTLSGQF